MSCDSRVRILTVLKILFERGPDDEPIYTKGIVSLLSQRGMLVERKSVMADLGAMKSLGIATYSQKRGWRAREAVREVEKVVVQEVEKRPYFGTFGKEE